jgi:hypothetical protein
MYEPGIWIPRVSPTPLLLVVACDDTITLADLALAACERALEPKRLALIPGGHFAPYLDQFALAEAAATGWFREHLGSEAVTARTSSHMRMENTDDLTANHERRPSLERVHK